MLFKISSFKLRHRYEKCILETKFGKILFISTFNLFHFLKGVYFNKQLHFALLM